MVGMDKWEIKQSELVCAVDIDGVLNLYPEPWVEFLNQQLGTQFTNLNEAKYAVPYQVYKNIKYEYRESGVKAKLPVRQEAKELTIALKELGYTIIILTSRPFTDHKCLFKQTTDWLNENGIRYDGLIFGSDKYAQILKEVPNLRFLLDDHRYYVNLVGQWGYPAYLLDNPYNRGELHPNVTRIKDPLEILEYEV